MTQKEKLEQAKRLYKDANADQRYVLEQLFPELAESEDEKIRKHLIKHFRNKSKEDWNGVPVKSVLAWLEKQGEPKSADKVEPKFNVGDWITDGNSVLHITNMDYGFYQFDDSYDAISIIDEKYHLWTIQDAKDGDVLATEDKNFTTPFIAIYKSLGDTVYKGLRDNLEFNSHCFIGFNGNFYEGEKGHSIEGIHPATKEQRDLLFQKMHEAGYDWDADKLELKKIEQKHIMIQWKGDNLKEVIAFTGKAPQFNKWFKTFDEYEQYVHNHNKIFKLFNEDGSHYEVPVGAWIVKTPDGYNVASRAAYKKPIWSKDDEEMFNAVIADIQFTQKAHNHEVNQIVYEREIDWLKSLKDRYTWEPSDEQMAALSDINCIGRISYAGQGQELINSYNDLKKLKENVL